MKMVAKGIQGDFIYEITDNGYISRHYLSNFSYLEKKRAKPHSLTGVTMGKHQLLLKGLSHDLK